MNAKSLSQFSALLAVFQDMVAKGQINLDTITDPIIPIGTAQGSSNIQMLPGLIKPMAGFMSAQGYAFSDVTPQMKTESFAGSNSFAVTDLSRLFAGAFLVSFSGDIMQPQAQVTVTVTHVTRRPGPGIAAPNTANTQTISWTGSLNILQNGLAGLIILPTLPIFAATEFGNAFANVGDSYVSTSNIMPFPIIATEDPVVAPFAPNFTVPYTTDFSVAITTSNAAQTSTGGFISPDLLDSEKKWNMFMNALLSQQRTA